jgi:outer membrane protein TolC
VNTAQDIHHIAEARARVGQVTKVDEIKAQATLLEAKITLERETMGEREP